MGRKKEKLLAPGIFVRLPWMDDFRVRQLVKPQHPLGVVARELMLAGLELERLRQEELREKQKQCEKKAKTSERELTEGNRRSDPSDEGRV